MRCIKSLNYKELLVLALYVLSSTRADDLAYF